MNGLSSWRQIVFFLLRFFSRQKLLFVCFIVLSLISNIAVKVTIPILSRWTIDRIIPQKNVSDFFLLISGAAMLAALLGLLGLLQNWFSFRLLMRPLLSGYLRVFNKSLRVDENQDASLTPGRLLQINIEDIAEITGSAVSTIPAAISNCIQVMVYSILCYTLNPRITMLAFALAPLSLAVQYFYVKIMRPAEKARQEQYIVRRNLLMRVFNDIHLVKLFNLNAFVRGRYKSVLKDVQRQEWNIWKKTAAIRYLEKSLNLITYGLGAYALYLVVRGSMTLGTFSALMMLLSSLWGPLMSLVTLIHSLLLQGIPLDRIAQLDNAREQRTGQNKSLVLTLAQASTHSLTANNLSFSYNQPARALDHISLTIPAGSHVGITGPTGSGKSTLARLLCGLETRSYEGAMALDAIPYTNLDKRAIRGQVLLCEQDIMFWPFSVYDNLTLGKPIGREAVAQLCRELAIHDAIAALPQGYDTQIFGDYQVALSGGQAQLIAIGRCLLHDAAVLIFDEATSAMDLAAEAHTLDVITRRRRGKTTLVISHRLHALRRFERIALLLNSRLAGFDTHDALMQSAPQYRELTDFYAC